MAERRVASIGGAPAELNVSADSADLARDAAAWLLDLVLAAGDRPALCLAGGSTPAALYHLLAAEPYRNRFPWQKVHWFWGDERFVPRDDKRSNFRMAWTTLFEHVPAPPENIHPIATDRGLAFAAADYERLLRQFYGADRLAAGHPLFAATLLGLGTDGHTASLFPGDPALGESERWVMPVPDAKPEPRITLTVPALTSAAKIAFLVSGTDKRAILARLRRGEDLPAGRIAAVGNTLWFIDRVAAEEETT